MKNKTQQEWQALLTRQAKSGLSAVVFCKKYDIGLSSFYKRKSALTQKANPQTPTTFIKAKVPANQVPISSIKIQHQHTHLQILKPFQPNGSLN